MDACNALIVDDEADIRELIEMTLLPLGVTCLPAENLSEARALLKRQPLSFCITDLRLPDGNGLELVAHIQKHYPNLPVAVITAHGNVESAVEALKLGAFDFVSKPFELAVLRNMVATALRLNRGGEGRSSDNRPILLGQSAAMAEVRALIAKLARSQAPIPDQRRIGHRQGTGGAADPLVRAARRQAVRAGQLRGDSRTPDGERVFRLQERQLHRRHPGQGRPVPGGAGRHAVSGRGGGLPMHMQVKLLRAIQERAVRPVGAQIEMATDVRILSATHKNLAALVKQGTFRQDLFYRLNVIELRLPSLREHPDDIPELVETILDRLSRQSGGRGRHW